MRELNGESALPTRPSHASSEAPAPGAPPASPARREQDEHIDLEALAARAGIAAEHVIPYGRDVAKIDLASLDGPVPTGEPAHYVVITAMTPTFFGEGKSTVAIGLAQGLAVRGERPPSSPCARAPWVPPSASRAAPAAPAAPGSCPPRG